MNIAGVDECGRGPLAGPVVAAAVILPDSPEIIGLADSKQLNANQRAVLEPQIKRTAISWAIAQVEVAQIDEINILQASLLAMKKAIQTLDVCPQLALIDGKFIPPGLACKARAIIKGDSRHAAISAASIIAKQYRDRLLVRLDKIYPEYGFASHKGYPTKAHLAALQCHGVTPLHRQSFAPVARIIASANTRLPI